MIKYEDVQVMDKQLVSITCDRCEKEYDDCMETQEFLLYSNDAGYGSVMGDGNKLRMELCQHCVKEVLGPYIRIEGNYIWNDTPPASISEMVKAIEDSHMDPAFDYLNHLLEGKDDH